MTRFVCLGLVALLLGLGTALARESATVDSFIRAETDRYFGVQVANGALGRFVHEREVTPVDRQPVVRMNRDTLYSRAIIDLDAGPATVTLPEPGGRFMSLMVLDQDHFVPEVIHGAGQRVFTRQGIGTRYVFLLVRTFVNPDDPADLRATHALQDGLRIAQADPGRFEVPDWDPESRDRLRDALKVLGATTRDSARAFGRRGEVDPVHHLIGAAVGWGGNPPTAAVYLNVVPPGNDGQRVHRLSLREVPVDGFWSISVYNREGFFEPNPRNAYSINTVTARSGTDGSVTVQFGGCTDATPNCLPVMAGWNYTVRLYRPRAEILDGRWRFPEAEPVR